MLAMLTTAVWRLPIDAYLSQRRRCLCPSSASPRSGCGQVQRHCSLSWGSVCVLFGRPPSKFVANNETLQQKPSLCTSADLFFSCCGSVAALPALANCNEHVAIEIFHARTHPPHTLHGGDGAAKLEGRTKLGDKGFEQVNFRHKPHGSTHSSRHPLTCMKS